MATSKEYKRVWGIIRMETERESPGSPVFGTQHFPCHGPGATPGWLKILQAMWRRQKRKRQYQTQER